VFFKTVFHFTALCYSQSFYAHIVLLLLTIGRVGLLLHKASHMHAGG